MDRKLLCLVLAAMIVGTAVAGCAQPVPTPAPAPTPAAAPPKTLDIGIMTPLTGPGAHLGTHIQNAILLAIDDQNKGVPLAGGPNKEGGVTIAGQKYTLNGIVFDDKFDVVVSKNIAEDLVFNKGVKVIAGPFLGDAVGTQLVTEKNKVMFFAVAADVPGLASPNKPYTFFCTGGAHRLTAGGGAYIQKFYPNLKKVASVNPDLPSLPSWKGSADELFPRYGLESLGWERFPADTKDFMPVISRLLAKNPDIVDTAGTAGDVGGMCASLIKQLREAGFNGLIWARTVPPIPVMEEIVPAKYLTNIVTTDILVDSTMVSQAYKDMYHRYVAKFGIEPIDVVGEFYDGVKAFLEFLNGQNAMDTTAWMQDFEKYRWQGVWGREEFWVGKPLWGIDRTLMGSFWISEYTNGKPEMKWEAPVPYDVFGQGEPQ